MDSAGDAMAELKPVIQADREMAADAVKAYRGQKNDDWQARIRRGECDDGVMVQAFAAHRIAHSPASEVTGEDAALVARWQRFIENSTAVFDTSFAKDAQRLLDLATARVSATPAPASGRTFEVFAAAVMGRTKGGRYMTIALSGVSKSEAFGLALCRARKAEPTYQHEAEVADELEIAHPTPDTPEHTP